MNDWLQQLQKYSVDHPFWQWLIIAGTAVAATLALKLALRLFVFRLRKLTSRTTMTWDDVGVEIVDGLRSVVIFAWAFYLLAKSLNPPDAIERALLIVVVVASIYQVGKSGLIAIRNWNKTVLNKRIQDDPSSAAALGLVYMAAQALFITIIVLIGLSNLGINISALLAGLGVGGIAVALAAQNILGDLFASLSIVLDKPFVVGDFVITGNEMGTVEQIGIKTTRLRSLSGEQLVVSNKDILESRIRNYKRMWQRRVVQSFGVAYSTPAETLEKIPAWVKGFVEKHDKLKFDRCHLARYGASSLDFELVFFVLDPDYNLYMDIQQQVMLDIFRKFSEEGVDFAFPTQTVYIERAPKKAAASKTPVPRPTGDSQDGHVHGTV